MLLVVSTHTHTEDLLAGSTASPKCYIFYCRNNVVPLKPEGRMIYEDKNFFLHIADAFLFLRPIFVFL